MTCYYYNMIHNLGHEKQVQPLFGQNPFLDSAFETMGLNPRVSPKILRVTFLYHQAHLSVAVLDQMHLTALGISEVLNACTALHASSIVCGLSTYSNVCSAPAYLLNQWNCMCYSIRDCRNMGLVSQSAFAVCGLSTGRLNCVSVRFSSLNIFLTLEVMIVFFFNQMSACILHIEHICDGSSKGQKRHNQTVCKRFQLIIAGNKTNCQSRYKVIATPM